MHRLSVAERHGGGKIRCDAKRARVLEEVAYLPAAAAAIVCTETDTTRDPRQDQDQEAKAGVAV